MQKYFHFFPVDRSVNTVSCFYSREVLGRDDACDLVREEAKELPGILVAARGIHHGGVKVTVGHH